MKKKALEKLTKELEEILQFVSKSGKEKQTDPMQNMMKQQSTVLIRHIMKRCVKSESLCYDVMQEHKSWERCMKYVTNKAKQYAVNSVACIHDEQVYEWAEDYFHMNDKEEVLKEIEEEKRRKAEAKKREEENKEKEKIAREKALAKLSASEEWGNLSEKEKEEKIKTEVLKTKYNIKTPEKASSKTKSSKKNQNKTPVSDIKHNKEGKEQLFIGEQMSLFFTAQDQEVL